MNKLIDVIKSMYDKVIRVVHTPRTFLIEKVVKQRDSLNRKWKWKLMYASPNVNKSDNRNID